MRKKVLVCILDGWGLGKKNSHNAVFLAKKKNFEHLTKKYGYLKLKASENDVGLPTGQFGNSEVGHTNIGAGRIILQDVMRISESFGNGEIKNKSAITNILENCKRIHIVGLISKGGVHGHQDHLFDLIEILNRNRPNIFIHCILDGRDSSPIGGKENLRVLKKKIGNRRNIKIASISGRFFAMDRDNRWERIEKAYKAIIEGSGLKKRKYLSAISESYEKHITDEFFEPTNFNGYNGAKDGDGFFITNYRADRVREILSSIFDDDFIYFKRNKRPKFFNPISMVEYSKRLKKKIKPIFESIQIRETLGEVVSSFGLKQLRVAETEKYAHVTYFLNGGVEEKFDGEDRILIPSPRVKTYDMKPEMSAFEVRDNVIENIKKKKYDLIITNFANPDMVGHTGNIEATIKAIEAVDECIGKIFKQCKKNGYSLILTSDHGNAENMFDEKKNIVCTTHSLNLVPFTICEKINYSIKTGKLSDIAPTVLKLLGLKIPTVMRGKPLIK